MVGVSYFHGIELINAGSTNAQLIDYNQFTIDLRQEYILKLEDMEEENLGFLLILSLLYVIQTNKGLGFGYAKLSGMIQF